MKRVDFIKELAGVLDFPLRDAKTVLDAVLDSMSRALQEGDRVELRGFGTLSTHVRGARNGRNPKTGTTVPVHPRRVAKFRPSKYLLALVNGTKPTPGEEALE